ncbi:ABC transporter substrate-binding protein [Sabulicella rubraurantiaca]|uniref:ABC transporter substrate-binding protein n=1 Tax=Sabulicella rubraurantiaca TaxID=2811429 RepID=UPI001A962565|nr:NrtA/SsuA/CpmA family ABC transporter substrate-binding protein [Sabulicella rubraurantiaca]
MSLVRRQLLAATAGVFAAPALVAAQGTRVRMGALRLIHSITPFFYERFMPEGMTVEVIPFESPTEGKNAVVTRSVDFGAFGVAAGILGAAAREPVVVIGSCCDKGMAIVARKDGPVNTLTDVRGRRVGIWPGSTQEVFIRERLRMEGMNIRDIQSIRVSFSEMHAALARGDIDAYVGAEPGPGISVTSGIGKIVEFPYSTAMGTLNMIFAAHHETTQRNPQLCAAMMRVHRRASEYASLNRAAAIEMAVQRLGMNRGALEVSIENVELNWRMTPAMIERSRTYAQHMQELQQIRQQPDFNVFFNTRFSDDEARTAA